MGKTNFRFAQFSFTRGNYKLTTSTYRKITKPKLSTNFAATVKNYFENYPSQLLRRATSDNSAIRSAISITLRFLAFKQSVVHEILSGNIEKGKRFVDFQPQARHLLPR